MNAPIVEDMVEVQCSCGRFHRLPSRIREFRCACHMTIGVNIDPFVSSEFIAALPTPRMQKSRLPLPTPSPLPQLLPAIEAPSRAPRAGEDEAWKGEMLDVMERVAELEDLLHEQQAKLAQMDELKRQLAEARANEAHYKAALEDVKPILKGWEVLEIENARLSRLLSVARDRGRVDVMDLYRRSQLLRKLEAFAR